MRQTFAPIALLLSSAALGIFGPGCASGSATSTCTDGVQNQGETDVDCGGGICTLCPLNKTCVVDTDCMSNACDAISNICVSDPCADHRQDGVETDIDCGGANVCSRCAVGMKCIANSDCIAGHTCATGTPHVCM